MNQGIRPQVKRLVEMGALPPDRGADPAKVDKFDPEIHAIARPVSNAEARMLLAVFGPDDCYGLAWTLLHLIETAPQPVVDNVPAPHSNWWIRTLWDRAQR